MTRSLFYHYFEDKEAVADAVLDNVIDEILTTLKQWNQARETGNVNKALDDIVHVLLTFLFADESPFSNRMIQDGNAELYIKFIDRAADRIADYIAQTTVRDFEQMHGLPITNVHETFFTPIVGLISLIGAASEHQRPNHQRGHGADAAYRKLCRLRSDGHWLWYRSPALPSVRFAASSSAIADSLRLTFWFDYRRTFAYKQPTGLFALRLSLMRGANIIGSRELAGQPYPRPSRAMTSSTSCRESTSRAATAGGTSTRNAQSSATTLNGKCPYIRRPPSAPVARLLPLPA